jgi:hypothetical protein
VGAAGWPGPPAARDAPAWETAHALRERITFRFAAELDLLLEKATLTEPTERVSMTDMAGELQACTAPPPEERPEASLGELRARVAALTAMSRQQVSDRQDRQGQVMRARMELAKVVSDSATELNSLLTFYAHSDHSGYQAAELLGRPPYTPFDGQSTGWLLLPVGQERPAVEAVVAAASRVLRKDDPADIAALLRVDRIVGQGLHEPQVIWSQVYHGIPIASAQQANVLADIRAGFTSSFADTLRRVIEIISESSEHR